MLNNIIKICLIFFILSGGLVLFVLFSWIPNKVRTEEATVPNLIGYEQKKAGEIAQLVGLRVDRKVKEKPSQVIPFGHVMGQDPLPNIKVKISKKIHIIVSSGSEMILVPNVIGKSVEEAKVILKSAGFRSGRIAMVHSDLHPKVNLVIAQTPPKNANHRRLAPVNLLLSSGVHPKSFRMPELKGVELKKARFLLEDHGIKIGKEEYQHHPKIGRGKIIGHQPKEGSIIRVGQTINLHISGSNISQVDRGEFIELKHELIASEESPVQVKIFVGDDNGTTKIIDKLYKNPTIIRRPYKTFGATTLTVYENGEMVRRERL